TKTTTTTHRSARLAAAIAAGRAAGAASRLLGRGGGTSLPGLVAERIDPSLTSALAKGLTGGSVVISGTNGKTTTTRAIAHVLRATGARVVWNQAGANLSRGIAS